MLKPAGGSAPAPFTPLSLSTNRFWADHTDTTKMVKAGGGTPAAGDAVEQLTEKSSSARVYRMLTGSRQPTYETGANGLNGGALYFTGSGGVADYLDLVTPAFILPAFGSGTPWRLDAVLRIDSFGGGFPGFFADGNTVAESIVFISSNIYSYWAWGSTAGSGGLAYMGVSNPVGNNFVVTMGYDGAGSLGTDYPGKLNNVAQTVNNPLGISAWYTARIGCTFNDSFPWAGPIKHIVLNVGSMSADDVTNLETWLLAERGP